MKLATRRLIDASATLPAADRALLSLWTQRGLDTTAVAQMTGVDPATIAERRARIVAGLSTELGLPPENVAAALAAIADSAAEAVAAVAPPASAEVPSSTSESQAEIEPEITATEPPAEPDADASDGSSRRRPALWLAATLLAIAVIAIVVITATSSGGASHLAAAARAPTTAAARVGALSRLPGGVAGASGSVTLAAGPAGTQRLLVRTTGLPAPGGDHYEVWLYNSIIDSVALGRLGPHGTGSFILPSMVARYASVDISRQPPGIIAPSGASALRAANPLASAPH